ncbi:hypothetical protein CK247_30670, partial [Klebsiella pneumoniae]
NGGIYDKAYAPLGLYIEDGKRLTPVTAPPAAGTFFIRPGGVFLNGGIYDKAYAPLGLYIEDGKRLTPVTAPPAAG